MTVICSFTLVKTRENSTFWGFSTKILLLYYGSPLKRFSQVQKTALKEECLYYGSCQSLKLWCEIFASKLFSLHKKVPSCKLMVGDRKAVIIVLLNPFLTHGPYYQGSHLEIQPYLGAKVKVFKFHGAHSNIHTFNLLV